MLLLSVNVHAAQVIEVHSGDTLTLKEQGKELKFRLANIDAPELDQPFGNSSRTSLEELCLGKEVSYEPQGGSAKDLPRAMVTCGELDASRTQLRRGMAWVMPDAKIDAGFAAIQDFVWRDKIGLWTDSDPVPPWEWAERKK